MIPGHNSGAGQLRALVERIERLDEEISTLNTDKSEVYKEAKATGFNVKVLRKVIAARRLDTAERQETEALFDMYMAALEGGENGLVRARVENIEEFPPAPQFPGAADGQPSIPSSDAGGAKMEEGAANASPERADDQSGHCSAKSEQAVPDFQPPAFLVKAKSPADYRPHCQNPSQCASSGLHHCHACQKIAAAAEGEAA